MRYILIAFLILLFLTEYFLPVQVSAQRGEVLASSLTGNVQCETDYGLVYLEGNKPISLIRLENGALLEVYSFFDIGPCRVTEYRSGLLHILFKREITHAS